MKKARRNESGKKLASRAGARAIVWLLLPILVFVLLNADYMPHVPHLTGTSVTEAAEYFRQSTQKVPSSGIEDTIWQQQERLLHDVAKFRAEHDSVVEAPPSRESSHEMAGKLVGANRGTESAIWQQQRQLLREVAELRAAHKELLLEVAKLRAAHDLAVRALPSPPSSDETPGKAVDAPPSPPSGDETTREAVDAQPSPPSSDETPGEAVDAQPSPASSNETPGEAVEALPSPTSSDETPGKANDAPPSPASNDETSVGVVDAQPSPPSTSDETHGEAVEAPPSPTSSDETPVVDAKTDVAALRSKSACDFSSKRMDICTMEGDVRVHGKAATVYVVSASDDSYRPENGMVTIHPYPRKSETETMQTIREVTIRWNDPPGPEAARCTVTHDVPAVVFSTGGYLSNFFHAMTDGIIPLFNTVWEYNGRVQLVVTDYNHEWVDKFRDILAALSNYPVIDFDADDEVRCFPSVHVGTESHKELGIIPAFSRKGYTMTDFQDFLRSVYSLKREWSTPVNRASGDRPRLAMILRRNSRAFANEAEAITAAMEVGFEVVSAGPEAVSDTARFAEVVNSCDVMVGVHGAGLANLVFLPRNATVLQVVPWGDLRWASLSAIGAPAADMGLRYVEYEATAEETTLKHVYPRDHAVFTDIPSINRQGYRMTWEIFLNGQNITLDIDRFRGVLQQIYQNTIMADPSPASSDETPGGGGVALPPPDQMPSEVVDANRDLKNEEKGLQAMNEGVDGSLVKQDVAAPRSKSSCDFRSERMDICAMEGDVRMHGKAATVYVVSASVDSYRPESGTVVIHPYTRKWEAQTMQIIREVTIRWIDPPASDAPGCTVTHDIPAVVFSTGGYLTNFFHGMTDGIIPLFNTAREYNGRVQLVATDYDPRWIAKFQGILSALSVYPVLDFDADDEVRCFPTVHVGTESHKELGIIPALSRKGYTMTDFREFLRSAFSLKREWSTPVNRASGERPRLVMVLRRRSRELANEAEAITAATEVGFEVVPAGPEVVSDMAQFAEVVNSCDVIMGVHGAGLTNLVFLPRNGTVMQIVPWGDMGWASFSAFGAPTADMGLRYVEYEATAEETTLKYVYPRDHAVFTDPRSIQKQGFGVAWWTFFNGQNVTLDINRFRGVLQQIYRDSVLADPSFDPAPVVEAVPSPASSDVVDANRALENEKGFHAMNGGADGSLIKSDVVAPRSKSSCDFRSERMDICTMDGDVRMHGKAATVYVVSASGDSYRPENRMVTIHPYTRKWEPQTMQLVREVTIRWSDPPGPDAPGCTVTHDVPAVVFSSGGYLANFFHAMTDGIIPLFNTAREFDGRVQLVATNYDSKWLAKFKNILAALSIYPVIDFDADDEVRCFPSVHVGTESHKELGIIPALSRKGYTMTDFRDFLRSAYSLKREWVTPVNITSGDRPRLVMVSRRRSREIANEAEAIATAMQVGFEVVTAGPEVVSDMARFAEVVNSCEVILGVHGAGLTNLVFLPRNGTVMQIVPWGDMRWASFSAFGAPTADMGLRYVEYEASAEETTLKYIYPRDHAVFTDPRSIQRQGFGAAWVTFFNGQNVTLDINRFRGVLQQIYHDSVLADPSFDPSSVVEAVPSPALSDVIDANRALENEKGFQAMNGGADGSLVKSDVVAPRSKSSCDFRSERMDICTMDGDVRMHGKAATVYVVSASGDSYRPENRMVTIHPYTRKWEPQTMQLIREVTIRWSDPSGPDAPGCTVTHDVPAVVFSSGGYLANFFHAMTDGIIPLFNTAREFDGRVQLVATNYDSKWLAKFKDILAALSIYPVIDFDADDEVRCFPSVRVGTESHKELGIIPALSHKGYTMTDFRDFLRSAYSLKREWATPVNITSGERPRLVMVSRRRSREIANEVEAIATATQVGFEVVSAGPEVVSDMARFAEVVNSCQVILGVHGAGLTNLVFLPRNGTVMQIVPWGDMRWASFSAFGAPTADMGLRYVEYEATAEETTLKYIYPRDHAVFTDPRSIHRLGFGAAWETFFNGQNVTLDIDRFRGVMQQIFQSVTIT